jgi:hypothetical protein
VCGVVSSHQKTKKKSSGGGKTHCHDTAARYANIIIIIMRKLFVYLLHKNNSIQMTDKSTTVKTPLRSDDVHSELSEDNPGLDNRSNQSKKHTLGTLFEKRHNTTFEYEPLINEVNTLFSANGVVLAEALAKIDAKCTATTASQGNLRELYKTPVDDPEARIARVKKFVDTAYVKQKPMDGFDDFDCALVDDESVVAVLNCSHISGMPSDTDDSKSVMGKIKVALVKSEVHGSRLLFSVADGSVDISIKDSFLEMQTEKTIICCCVQVCTANKSELYHISSSNF